MGMVWSTVQTQQLVVVKCLITAAQAPCELVQQEVNHLKEAVVCSQVLQTF